MTIYVYIFKELIYAGQGSEPEWNETFVFTISEGTSELVLKIMDRDTLTDDDYLGKARSVAFIFIWFNIFYFYQEDRYTKMFVDFIKEERNIYAVSSVHA